MLMCYKSHVVVHYIACFSGLRLDNSMNSMGPQSPLDLKPDTATLMVNFSPPENPLSPG